MISRLLKRRSYRGGPHFDQLSKLCFDLEGTTLELTVPKSDAEWKNPPRPLNYPFKTTGWFEKNHKRQNLNDYVHLYTEIWHYFPARMTRLMNLMIMGRNEPSGELSISAQLNRVADGKALNIGESHSLAEYIRWEYDDFYESPVQGKYCRGNNYKVRKEQEALLARWGEEHRGQYEAALAQDLMPTPKNFTSVEFGGARWTYFELGKPGWVPSRFYCLPLSERYYLQVEISPAFHMDYRPVLEKDMLQLADWLVQHIKITYPSGMAPGAAGRFLA